MATATLQQTVPLVHETKPRLPLNALLSLPTKDLGRRDVAAMNLDCAEGLPGAEGLDIAAHLATLDAWTARVAEVTARNHRYFRNHRSEFDDSKPLWRMLTLTTVLQLQFRIRYNPAQIDEMSWADSRDLFLHGLTGPSRTGTCPSLPVLIVAVGRRLGYPLRLESVPEVPARGNGDWLRASSTGACPHFHRQRPENGDWHLADSEPVPVFGQDKAFWNRLLVHAPAHVFSRWDDPGGERFNIECHGNGMSTHPDEYYHEWPVPWTAELEAV